MSVRNCEKCHIFEAKPQIPPMEPIICTEPLDLVHIDYVSMEVTVGMKEKPVVKNVLVVEDHFTCYTQTCGTNNHTARITARVLYNELFSVFGFPRRLMSDQASEFMGQVISELCAIRAKWPSHLGPILIAYNATRSLITGYSPYFLMFGR